MASLNEAFQEHMKDGKKGNIDGPEPLKSSRQGDEHHRRHRRKPDWYDRPRHRDRRDIQYIGYGRHHRRHHDPYRRGYIHREPIVYTQPVIYRQPVVYTTDSSDSSSFWDNYSTYIWIVLFIIFIIFVVSLMSNLTRKN
tara:strand:+ start:685 stop:1101 length:417 start_codon:yes stop_codon:yes gene_type:complete